MATKSPCTAPIAYAKIHPAIGIARIGNSTAPDGFYIGPQVPYPDPEQPGFYRDHTGKLKREVAEFRIYGYSAAGDVICELTPDDNTSINWTVELANHKAAWYNFELALDIPEAATAPATTRRNAKFPLDRSELSITPGPRTISGRDKNGEQYHFTDGKFATIDVPLGELRTDAKGRLQVFGGLGKSGSGTGDAPVTFANNDGWYDDTSDGPVTAQVLINGKAIEVKPAWVVVAPPNYAPAQKSVRTLYALLTDVFINCFRFPRKAKPSFATDIYPIFKAMTDLQWVNAGIAAGFGVGSPHNFLTDACLARLASTAKDDAEFRRTIANSFRNPARGDLSQSAWPWVYGDAMDVPMPPVLNAMNALTPTQLRYLEQWAQGDFDSDLPKDGEASDLPELVKHIDQAALKDQPRLLDQAALEFCLADAFHPGCEMTWPIRHATMFSEPYRLLHREIGNPEPDLGPVLTPDNVLSKNGPLYGQSPGSITRWMAIPWQTDTASCRSGYDKAYDPYVPTFWPARVPNQVLSAKNFAIVSDKNATPAERAAAFKTRDDWNRTLGEPKQWLANMITQFDQMGVVEARKNPCQDEGLPAYVQVEDRGGIPIGEAKLEEARLLQVNLFNIGTP